MIYTNGQAVINRLWATSSLGIIAGNMTAVQSLTAVTVAGSDLQHASLDSGTAVGDLVHIISGTGVTAGYYRILTVGANQVTVDRAPGGAGADIVLNVWKDVLLIQATDATNGQFIGNFSAQNKPLQIGGHTYVSTTDLTSEDVVFGGEVKFVTNVYIGDSANAKSTLGLTINQAGNDDEIISLKSSDVGHSFTTDTEADTFLYGKKLSATLGGAGIWGLSDGDATGLQLTGGIGIADPTNTIPAVVINGVKLSGTTYGALGNPETVFQVQNNTTPLMTVLGSGSTSFINSVFASPIITKGPAAVAAGFVGTVTAAASTTVTFSSAADAILAGYDASNPVLGVTLISNALTRYIVSWTNATTAEVDTAVTWAGTAITSIQFPEGASIRSNGTLDEAMLANGNKYFANSVGIGTTNPGAKLDVVGNLKISGDYGVGIFIVNGLLGSAGSWTELQSNENAVADRYFTRYWSDYDNDSQGKTERFSVQTDGTTYIAGNLGIGTTTFGTNLTGGLAMGLGTAPTGTITGAQLVPVNENGASTASFHMMNQIGQYGAVAFKAPLVNLLSNSGMGLWSNGTLENVGNAIGADDMSVDNTGNWTLDGVTLSFDTDHYEAATALVNKYFYLPNKSVTAGKLYKFSVQIKDGTAAGASVYFYLTDGVVQEKTLTTTAGWVTETFVLEAQTTTAAASIGFRISTNLGGNNIEFKNFTLYEVTPGCVAADALGPDGWTKSTSLSIYRQHNDGGTLTKDGNFYSLKLVPAAVNRFIMWAPNGVVGNTPEVYQKYAGRTMTIGGWVKTSTASHFRWNIYDDGDTYGSYHTGGGDWEWIEYTKTISATTTYVIFSVNMTQETGIVYLSSPMLVFGPSIGAGNYAPSPNETIYTEKVIALTDYTATTSAADATINLEAQSSGFIPKGVKAVLVKAYGKDSAAGDGVGFDVQSASGVEDGLSIDTQVNNIRVQGQGWVKADANGDIYFDHRGSGASALTVDLKIIAVQP